MYHPTPTVFEHKYELTSEIVRVFVLKHIKNCQYIIPYFLFTDKITNGLGYIYAICFCG